MNDMHLNKAIKDKIFLGKAMITLGVISIFIALILISVTEASAFLEIAKGFVPGAVLAGIVFPMIGVLILAAAKSEARSK